MKRRVKGRYIKRGIIEGGWRRRREKKKKRRRKKETEVEM